MTRTSIASILEIDQTALDLAEQFGTIGGALIGPHGKARVAWAFLGASLSIASELEDGQIVAYFEALTLGAEAITALRFGATQTVGTA